MKAAIGAVLAALVSARAVAGLPDWAKAVAEAAPPIAEGLQEWPERTLFTETHIVVGDDGITWRIKRRKVVQVLSNRVDEVGFGAFAFDDTTKIKKSKGWHVPPGERAHRDLGGAVDLTLSADFLTDQKARFVALDGVRKGSLLVYEFDAESRPYTLTAEESFYDDVPVAVARWSIELPSGWTLKHAWLPGGGPEPVHSASSWVFEQRDLAPKHGEPLGEKPWVSGPRLVVALQPPADRPAGTPAFADWDGLARWYRELAQGREAATPAIEAAAKAQLAGAGPAPLARIRALAKFVRDRVRYVAREVGVGGYQPHAASQVLAELYGDCKDKGTLLRAMLGAAGYATYPILIHASNPYTVAPDVPTPTAFDHFVIGVAWPADAPFPEEAASARIEAGDAGTLLVIDATDEYAWPGTLPDNLAGKPAVVVTGTHGVVVRLPEARPAWHRIARSVTAAIAPDHGVAMTMVSRLFGGPAEEARAENARSFKERRESVERRLRSAWPGAEVSDYKVTPEDGDGAYVEAIVVGIPAGASTLQDKVFWMFAGATQDIARLPLGKRTTTVVFPYPIEIRYEVSVTGAAPTTMPASAKLSGAAWSVETTFDAGSPAMRGVWQVALSATSFAPEAFTDLKQFWSAASKAAAPGVRLE